MKKIILAVMFTIFSLELVTCMEEWEAYIDVVHNGIEGSIIAKTSPATENVKLMDCMANTGDQVNLSENKMKLDVLFSDINIGNISIFLGADSEQKLLTMTLQREDEYGPAKVRLSEIASGLIVVVYNPVIGGGYNFVLALGRSEADVSIFAVQQVLQKQHPLIRLQSYFQVVSGIGSIIPQ